MRKELCRYRSPKEQDGEVLSIAADAEVLTTKGEFWKFFNADSCYKLFRKLYYLTAHLLIYKFSILPLLFLIFLPHLKTKFLISPPFPYNYMQKFPTKNRD
jgi:hypothetical protein